MKTDELAVECTWCDGQKERFINRPCDYCQGNGKLASGTWGRAVGPKCPICLGTGGYVGLYHCEACT